MKQQLETKIGEANSKIAMLTKSEHKYTELYLEAPKESQEEELPYLSDNKDRRTGRIIMKLTGAINLANRKSLKNEIIAIVRVDGSTKYTSRATKNRWDESINFQVDRALEVELLICEKGAGILACTWFKLSDLEEHHDRKFGENRANLEMNEKYTINQ